MTLKTELKRLIPKQARKRLKSLFSVSEMDEVDMVFSLLKATSVPRIMYDVGAHHGGSLDEFARLGWVVHAFEPDSINRAILQEFCSGWQNVTIDARAVSNKEETGRPFFSSAISSGISSLAAFHDTHCKACCVETITLKTYCEKAGTSEIGFLKIDTEGFDLSVLQGVPWDAILPHVVLCEFEDRKTLPLGYNFHQLAQYVRSKGYNILVSEWYPVVQYGARHKWRRLSRYPCSLADPNAWGNIIGIRDRSLFDGMCRSYAV